MINKDAKVRQVMVEVRTHDCEFLLPLALPPDLPPVILMDLGELENWLRVSGGLNMDVGC